MITGHEDTISWHLTHSRLDHQASYGNAHENWRARLDTLIERLRGVLALDAARTDCEDIIALRDELAFHLVKTAHWWGVDLFPQVLLGLSREALTAYARHHAGRSDTDETFLDLLTEPGRTIAGITPSALVLTRDDTTRHPILIGLDERRSFRFGWIAPEGMPLWGSQPHADFLSAWIAARVVASHWDIAGKDRPEWRFAREEHNLATIWHRRHFASYGDAELVQAYSRAQTQRAACRSAIGMVEMERIADDLAFRIARRASESGTTIRTLLLTLGTLPCVGRLSASIATRAREHVLTGKDPARRPALEHMLDSLVTD